MSRRKTQARSTDFFADLLRQPAFEQSRVELAKLQALEGIRRRQDSPGSIVGREFAKLLYGPPIPARAETSVRSIESITAKTWSRFISRPFIPTASFSA